MFRRTEIMRNGKQNGSTSYENRKRKKVITLTTEEREDENPRSSVEGTERFPKNANINRGEGAVCNRPDNFLQRGKAIPPGKEQVRFR